VGDTFVYAYDFGDNGQQDFVLAQQYLNLPQLPRDLLWSECFVWHRRSSFLCSGLSRTGTEILGQVSGL
jgi:hypothetical protein